MDSGGTNFYYILFVFYFFECKQEQKVNSKTFRQQVEGGAFDNYETPFGVGASEGINRGKFESTWVVELEVPEAFEVSIKSYLSYILLYFYIFA